MWMFSRRGELRWHWVSTGTGKGWEHLCRAWYGKMFTTYLLFSQEKSNEQGTHKSEQQDLNVGKNRQRTKLRDSQVNANSGSVWTATMSKNVLFAVFHILNVLTTNLFYFK